MVTGEDGVAHLVYKAKGVGGALYARPLDLGTLRTRGPATRLLAPERGERGVTEGPALLRRDGWWYLFFSSGNCCGPPCTASGRDGIATLGVHQRGGVLRGVEISDGRARAVRRRGSSVKVGQAVRVPRDRAVRVRVTALKGGGLRAEVRRGERWVRVPGGPAARGDEPTRIALACRGSTRIARFSALRVEGATPGVALAVQAAAGRSAR